MSKIYCVIDNFGFIAAFSIIQKARKFIKEWEDKVELFIMEFSINDEKQKNEIYFMPYKGHEGCHNFPVALVTNDKEYYLNVQSKLVKMGLAFPDDIEPFIEGIIGEGVSAAQIPGIGWVGSLDTLEPGKGYWFKVTQDITFQFNQ